MIQKKYIKHNDNLIFHILIYFINLEYWTNIQLFNQTHWAFRI